MGLNWSRSLAIKANGFRYGLGEKMRRRFSTSSSKNTVRRPFHIQVWKSGTSYEVSLQEPAELVTGSMSTLESKTLDQKTHFTHSTECERNSPTESRNQLEKSLTRMH